MPEYIIYRKSDRLIVGFSYRRANASLETAARDLEVQNIVNSQLGGVTDDYDYIEVDAIDQDRIPTINPDLTITYSDRPAPRDFASEYAAARNDAERIGIIAESLKLK